MTSGLGQIGPRYFGDASCFWKEKSYYLRLAGNFSTILLEYCCTALVQASLRHCCNATRQRSAKISRMMVALMSVQRVWHARRSRMYPVCGVKSADADMRLLNYISRRGHTTVVLALSKVQVSLASECRDQFSETCEEAGIESSSRSTTANETFQGDPACIRSWK